MSNHFFFFFLDGVGLGSNDPSINPFSRASMPCLKDILEGNKLVAGDSPSNGIHFSLTGLDAVLGVPGMPQSASGQAALLTGLNVPNLIGGHYGPKPNEQIAKILAHGNLFINITSSGRNAGLINAYPQRFFDSINSGRRLLSAIPLAVESAGLTLKNSEDYFKGNALSADFTGKGWREHLKIADAPVYTPFEAGKKLASLALSYDFAFFEFWFSDYAGHAQDMASACALLTEFDEMLCGLLSSWDLSGNLLFFTSDHGNLEDLSTHRHTLNQVPALVIADSDVRKEFTDSLKSLVDVAPAIMSFLGISS